MMKNAQTAEEYLVLACRIVDLPGLRGCTEMRRGIRMRIFISIITVAQLILIKYIDHHAVRWKISYSDNLCCQSQ